MRQSYSSDIPITYIFPLLMIFFFLNSASAIHLGEYYVIQYFIIRQGLHLSEISFEFLREENANLPREDIPHEIS